MKWYTLDGPDEDVIVASRIRLVRGIVDRPFPWKLDQKAAAALTAEMKKKLSGLGAACGRTYESCLLAGMNETQRKALRERSLINKNAVLKPGEAGLMLSADEAVSIVMNSEDHFRIQVSRSGSDLRGAWKEADLIDDYIGDHYPYAYDEQFGYLTTYPTNLGTGMRAYQVLHLPLLDSVSRFSEIVEEINRYGLKLKPAFSQDRQQNGNMHVLFNEKTLGSSEEEVIDLLERISSQLCEQERELRDESVKQHRLEVEDLCCKAYGTILYSRLMTKKMAMSLLSQMRWGAKKNVISFKDNCSFYSLMLDMQDGALAVNSAKKDNTEGHNMSRAEWLKDHLPLLAETNPDSTGRTR